MSDPRSIKRGTVSQFPSPAQDYQQTQIDLNKILIKDRANTFVLRVYGDSMEGAGIYDQDEIIVERTIKPRTGKVVDVSLDREFTIKRLGVDREGKGWLLRVF
ncbi:S24 family peptidase [Microbacterium foliorum]|uniref:LexA family protein n=1 Tax=Rothia terrae TaxID=396015 RepID=UPI001B34F76A|nr:S24 family peptidase [Rothia terrae]